MKRFSIFILFLINHFAASAQEKTLPISVSIFNNGTMLPGSGYVGIFSKNIHPGITLGTAHLYGSGQHHELFQTLKLGYFYHHFSQHAIQLYSELGYRYLFRNGLYADALLGVGYLHSFADVQQFTFKDGIYKRKVNWGRPQFMGSFSLSVGYDLQNKMKVPLRLFLQYQFWIQTPFVNKYVPLLPNNAVHIGAIYQLPKRNKNKK